jgi:hypothetical protein
MGKWMRKILFMICILFIADQKTFAENNWEQKADFPGDGRSAVSSFGFSDYGFVGLGYDGEDFRRSFYAYDPLTDSWFQTESLGGAIGEGLERNVAAAFTIGNKGYIGTGQGGDPFLNDFGSIIILPIYGHQNHQLEELTEEAESDFLSKEKDILV